MGIVGLKMKKETKPDRTKELKAKARELWHLLEMAEFAEKKDSKELKESYEKEAIGVLVAIKKDYGDMIEKFM